MADKIKRVKKEAKKSKSANKKSNTQAIRQTKYNSLLNNLQEGSQNYKILKHLIKRGHTTSLEIMTLFYTMNPQARIYDLRKYGANISTKMITKTNAEGVKITFGRYTLEV